MSHLLGARPVLVGLVGRSIWSDLVKGVDAAVILVKGFVDSLLNRSIFAAELIQKHLLMDLLCCEHI